MAYGYGKSFMLQQDMVECLQHDTGYINLLCGHAITNLPFAVQPCK